MRVLRAAAVLILIVSGVALISLRTGSTPRTAAAEAAASVPTAAEPLPTGGAAQGLPTEKVLTIDVAQAMAQAAMLACRAKGYRVTVTVVDRGNELKALLRDDGAGLGSVIIGRMKTNSVMHFGYPSGPPAANPPPGTATPTPMSDSVFAKGGLPIKIGDDLLGAISASGAHNGETDASCAQAGLDKVADQLK
jgi:uncharacterized protein GlcG (DUF336 family)